MKNNRLAIVLIILAIVFTIIGSTFAYWSWTTNSSQLTGVTFTIASGFTCGANGGGNITSSDVSLAPAECTNSTYAIKRTVTVTTTQSAGKTIYLNMNLKVNSIGTGLAASQNFKYALTTMSTSCESGVLAEGNFYGAEADTELPLLTNERYTSGTNDYLYLWVWLDKEETSATTQNQTFDLTLSGSCTDQEPAKTYAPWGEEVDMYKRIDFSQASSPTNGEGLYVFQPTKNDTNPIYYYRGAVSNNNVIFGNYCWKIVRTTETGGIKMIYSGTPTSGSCINTTGSNVLLSASVKFIDYYNKVGYMYNNDYVMGVMTANTLNTVYKYGNSFYYSGGTYTLVDTIDSTGTWSADYTSLNGHHYTCFNTTGTCSTVKYVYYTSASYADYVVLTNGKSIETFVDESFISNNNLVSSDIKNYIDDWYEGDLISEENKLEDAVWCVDRRILYIGGLDPNGTMGLIKLGRNRTVSSYFPNLKCQISDSFTKSNANGNGCLDNPIGLLTYDEALMAGSKYDASNNITFYLYSGWKIWLMTPFGFQNYSNTFYSTEYGLSGNGNLSVRVVEGFNVNSGQGVRPAISLKPGATWSGNGTSDSPYTVSYS